MDLLVPRISELLPALISLAVVLIVIGGSIYLVRFLRRSVRAQEGIAAALVDNDRSIDGPGSE